MEKIFRAIALLAMVWFQLAAFSAEAEEDAKAQPLPRFSDYRLVDSELKLVGIDSDATESFLALDLDSAGRLFAGGREALFVYEPAKNGLYQPRPLLYRFPKDSWIYGLAIRGADLYVSTHTAVYVLEGAVLKRTDIKPKRLLWGQPMLPYFEEHQGMHALAFGPEGDLYFSAGDNLVGYGDFQTRRSLGALDFLSRQCPHSHHHRGRSCSNFTRRRGFRTRGPWASQLLRACVRCELESFWQRQ